jgi:GNAT superfamily N-acetyltransferase
VAGVDDAELARRSVLGFAETVAALGSGAGAGGEAVRRAGAIGALVPAASENHWLDAAVVPLDAAPPAADDDGLPHCLWSVAEAIAGRDEQDGIAMPCLGVTLDDRVLDLEVAGEQARVVVERPSFDVVGAVNDRAYEQYEQLLPLVRALDDPRAETHGLRVDDEWACVMLTLRVGDDVSIQYVATEQRFRRRGLASRLILGTLAAAREDGAVSATLQASPDGLPVYERLGFRRVALLKAFVR